MAHQPTGGVENQEAQSLGSSPQQLGGQRQSFQGRQHVVSDHHQSQPGRIRSKILAGHYPAGQFVLHHVVDPFYRSRLLPMPLLPRWFHHSEREKPLRSGAWRPKMPVPATCSCSSAGRAGTWQFLSLNWPRLMRTSRPPKPSATGTTGWRKATASEADELGRSHAGGLGRIEDGYGQTSVKIATHVDRCQSKTLGF